MLNKHLFQKESSLDEVRMFPSADDRAVVLDELDEYLKTILKFKIREFIHLNPCFEAIPSIDVRRYPIDVRNYRRLLLLEQNIPQHKPQECHNKKRVKATRRRILRYLPV
ncbi:hypothetical protein KF913_27040 [Candidatus Obscuribacterales bacterium]|nr:hypothetical protein [Candidatus Obscuribacterales bacterium]